MPISIEGGVAALCASCVAEEALPLGEWLFEHRGASVDISACTNLHSAILQTLLAFRPVIRGESHDAFVARWIVSIASSPERR